MSEIWETKYGLRRVRHDPPTLDEAIAAAQGLSDELDEQVEIAAGLMALPVDVVRAEILKAAKPAKSAARVVMTPSREGATRTVIVERKPSRRVRTTGE
jgi:2-phospho-L-lactate guanylyltransferase (CobY/MobA/RfbA family)